MNYINKPSDWSDARSILVNSLYSIYDPSNKESRREYGLLALKINNMDILVAKCKCLKRKQSKRRALIVINGRYEELNNELIMFTLKY